MIQFILKALALGTVGLASFLALHLLYLLITGAENLNATFIGSLATLIGALVTLAIALRDMEQVRTK